MKEKYEYTHSCVHRRHHDVRTHVYTYALFFAKLALLKFNFKTDIDHIPCKKWSLQNSDGYAKRYTIFPPCASAAEWVVICCEYCRE